MLSDPSNLTAVGNALFFTAAKGVNDTELWRSDGTPGGTAMVKDISAGSANPHELTNVNGTLYFIASDDTHGEELWRSDGTEDGTVMVKDINEVPDPSSGAFLRELTNVDGTLYFIADDGTHGEALWRSNGTEDGTVMVKDINPGLDSGFHYLRELSDVGGSLLFSADDGTHGEELWRSDGTEDGTVMVKDINQTPDPSAGSHPEWRSPPVITRRLYRLPLYFRADDGIHGIELWKTDGTPGGTELVEDINPGAPSSGPAGFLRFGGVTFFSALKLSKGVEPWGASETGTHILKDINLGEPSSAPINREVSSGVAYFSANDGSHGYELWRSDGTEANTKLVKDINPGSNGGFVGVVPLHTELTDLNGTLYFSAENDVSGEELWQSSGTEATTQMVDDINPGSAASGPRSLTVVNGTLYFSADDGGGDGPQLYGLTPPLLDGDGDGIANEIDTQPGVPSDEFSDNAAPTYGKILDGGGLTVTITDASYTDGVNISVPAGVGKATLSVCGGFVVEVAAGTEAVITCGSLSIQVVQGEAQVSAGDGSIAVSVPAEGVAKLTEELDGSVIVENPGAQPLTISLPGTDGSVSVSIPSSGVAKLIEDESDGSITVENPGEVPLTVITEGDSSELHPAEEVTVDDSTAPETIMDSAPTSSTSDPTPSFTFHASQVGSTFECKVDAGPFASCSSPFTTSALGDGLHAFQVRATDPAGNTDPSPASKSFAVSIAAPVETCATNVALCEPAPIVDPPPAPVVHPPSGPIVHKPPLKCRKGFRKKTLKGKARCLKRHKHHKKRRP